MVEEVLLKYNNNSLFDFRLLDYNFDHEHEWIENQIFSVNFFLFRISIILITLK